MTVTRSPLIAMASAPACHRRAITVRISPASRGSRRRCRPADGLARVVESRRSPCRSAGSARPRSAPPRGGRSDRDVAAVPGPGPRPSWICLAQGEDLRLQLVLLGLQPEGGLNERRALLGRVADARTLRGELGGDQESKGEKRKAERHLPRRDRRGSGRVVVAVTVRRRAPAVGVAAGAVTRPGEQHERRRAARAAGRPLPVPSPSRPTACRAPAGAAASGRPGTGRDRGAGRRRRQSAVRTGGCRPGRSQAAGSVRRRSRRNADARRGRRRAPARQAHG